MTALAMRVLAAVATATILLGGCVVAVPPPRPPQSATTPYPSAPAKPTVSMLYRGVTRDVVGRGFQPTPNGDADAQFTVTIDPQGIQRRLNGFVLYTSDARGNPVHSNQATQTWSTTGDGWFLAVEATGRRLNPSDRAVNQAIGSITQFDLFADGAKAFTSGQYVTLIVRFSDGARITNVLRID